MAIVKKNVVAPPPPTVSYMVELTDKEAAALVRLLGYGASGMCLSALGLYQLFQQLDAAVGNHLEDPTCQVKFASTAHVRE